MIARNYGLFIFMRRHYNARQIKNAHSQTDSEQNGYGFFYISSDAIRVAIIWFSF